MDYDQTADGIARNIWEISNGNGARLPVDLWDDHRANCDAAVANSYVEGMSTDEWQRAALDRIEGKKAPRRTATPTEAGAGQ